MRLPTLFILSCIACVVCSVSGQDQPAPPPNVLWIVADDLGPELSCYGTRGVRTPNIDRLASQGMRFTNAFSTAPVCSTSRSALITGVSQTAIGCRHHRTINKQPLPEGIEPLPALLAEHGVPSFNGNFNLKKRGKTDYNFSWNGGPLYQGADWEKAQGGPFFAQVQIYEPHRTFKKNDVAAREVALEPPSWLPEHPLVRADEAGYLKTIEVLDAKVGRILDRLETEGLAQNTVVIFVGDHGRPQVRGKQWLYNAGLHVPLIIRWPGTVEAGAVNDELTSLIDLAPTTLAAMGFSRPPWMHGRVLVGPKAGKPVDAIFAARDRCDETIDAIRSVRTQDHTYIRNLAPERPWMQVNAYKDRQYPARSLLRVMHEEGMLQGTSAEWMSPQRPAEELYDRKADPAELNNLAEDPTYASTLMDMRSRLDAWMLRCSDPGNVPEEESTLAVAQGKADAARARTLAQTKVDPIGDPAGWLQRSQSRLVSVEEDGWRPLIQPGSFQGWHELPGGEWVWEDDVLIGRSEASERRHGLLVSDYTFGDFEVRLEFRTISGCSGFYFRVEEREDGLGVAGFQAEIDPSMETGGLYETSGRAWVVKPDPERMKSVYHPGEWTQMRVTARGGVVEVRINGQLTARLEDDPGRLEGHFALQLHGGQDLHVEFRDLQIRP